MLPFAARLESARSWKGLSQRGLARAIGVSPSRVLQWHRQETPHLSTMNKLADLLGVSRYWLLTGECCPTRMGRCPFCKRRF